jgi:hypothetical protein
MPFSNAEKSKVKKHLNYLPSTTIMDAKFEQIEADATWLSDTQTAISTCDTRKTAWETAKSAAGKVTSGFGAKLNEDVPIDQKRELYINAVEELSRWMEFPRNPFDWEVTAHGGWFGG